MSPETILPLRVIALATVKSSRFFFIRTFLVILYSTDPASQCASLKKDKPPPSMHFYKSTYSLRYRPHCPRPARGKRKNEIEIRTSNTSENIPSYRDRQWQDSAALSTGFSTITSGSREHSRDLELVFRSLSALGQNEVISVSIKSSGHKQEDS